MCNMSCKYCFYNDEAKKRSQSSYGFMTEQTLKNVIRKTMLSAEKQIYYVFQGGEPTLIGMEFFERAVALQKHYNQNQIQIVNAIQTNGYLLNEEWCDFFKKNHFLVGLSVDGTKDAHDFYRCDKSGNGSYEKVLHAARLLEQYQVDYNILTVITPAVTGNIKKIYNDYRKKGWNYQQYILCLEPLGEKRGQNTFSLGSKEYGKFLAELFQLWYEDYKKGKQPYIRQFDNYIGLKMGYMAESCEQCGVCGIQNIVEADGSVYPCDFYALDEYCLGNLNRVQLEEIDKQRKKIGFIEKSFQIVEECRLCKYYHVCRGGCQRNREYISEKKGYRNYFCEGYKLFFDECYEQIAEIARDY